MSIRDDANLIIKAAIDSAMPDTAVKKALSKLPPCGGKIYSVAIGKAAHQMTMAAKEELGDRIFDGVCITKYHHLKGPIEGIRCFEAGHPVLDENSVKATKEAEKMVAALTEDDLVIFLISGGGSALFEDPAVPLTELQEINKMLLSCGADITEINTIRKRLSNVKGGRFAGQCKPAKVFSIVLSDIIGDPLDMIASGPAYPDSASVEDTLEIVKKYKLEFSPEVMELLKKETPKKLENVTTVVTGSVKQLCDAAGKKAKDLGYEPVFLTACLDCEAKAAGSFLSAIAREHAGDGKKKAYILGGETVVKLTGKGLGGRNQEIALAAAEGIDGLSNVCIFSVGSDGTDGPTDAAGGIVTGDTRAVLKEQGIVIHEVLDDNDAYHALQKCDGLVITGPTGTNVNDVTVLLIDE
ncbi:MAG: glycerate kinase [Lachnospiraceae bacterium]|jgi:hydroxypyruvate reductase|nr:glycerate kinase [Lachnospiraceae bacterium]